MTTLGPEHRIAIRPMSDNSYVRLSAILSRWWSLRPRRRVVPWATTRDNRDFLPRFIESQRAFHDGDAEPNIALWTTTDPVTLLAARGTL